MPSAPFIPYSRQWIDDDDIAAVVKTLKSDWLTQGPQVPEFEEKMSEFCGSRYGVSFSSGTAALHAACHVSGLKKGDIGLVPPISFAASANCLLYVGAKPQFVDVTKNIPLIDSDALPKNPSPEIKALIPVHYSGSVATMATMYSWAKKHQITIIEDACHAFGSKYLDKNQMVNVGSCQHSDMTVFSFHPVKPLTTGEGGMVMTNNESFYEKLKQFRTHGMVHPQNKKAWYSEMTDLGFNYRMTELQAALGISQLKKYPHFLELRRQIFEKYKEKLKEISEIELLIPPDNVQSSHHLANILVHNPMRRDPLFDILRAKGIGAQIHYIPIYKHPYYQKMGFDSSDYPNSEEYFAKTLSIPLYPQLTDADFNRVIETLKQGLMA